MRRFKFLPLAITMAVLVLVFYFFSDKHKKHEGVRLPDYAMRNGETRLSYQFALDNFQILDKIPCYCGCYQLGHQSNGDCFVREFKDNGGVIFERHGAYCGMCYSIALDTKQLFEQGKTVSEIRRFIDDKYSKYGRGTSTPL